MFQQSPEFRNSTISQIIKPRNEGVVVIIIMMMFVTLLEMVES